MHKNHTVLIVSIFVLVVFLLIVFWRQIYLKTLMNETSKVISMIPDDFTYRSVGLTMGGSGILFYKPQFKAIPFPCNIEKMSVRLNGNDVEIGLKGVSFNVTEALRSLKGEQIEQSLKTYVPYKSIWTNPLESLAFAGVENVKFNATFKIINKGLSRQIVGEVFDKKLGKALFDLSIPSETELLTVGVLVKNPMIHGVFSWEDISLISPYQVYAKSLGYVAPINALTHVVIK